MQKKLRQPMRNSVRTLPTGNVESLTRSLRFRISGLKSCIMASTSNLTEVQMHQLSEAKPALEKMINDANSFITDLNTLAKEAAHSGLYPTAVKPIEW